MEIRNLSAFIQVAATQNFTQAAKILGYSQSNVSMQIQQLEKEIGVQLFDRIGHHVALTHYGQELLPYAQQIVSTASKMQNIKRTDESLCGVLKIGMVESLFNIVFKETIEKYHQRFPNVKVELTMDEAASLQESLKNGKIDIACIIDSPVIKSKLNCLYTKPCQIVIVSNTKKNLELLNKKIGVNDIANKEFILMEESASYSLSFQNWMASYNIEPKVFLKLQSTDMARKLVETGDFLSVLPLYTVNKYISEGSIRIIEIPEFDFTQYIQIVINKPKVITPQMNGFTEEIEEILKSIL